MGCRHIDTMRLSPRPSSARERWAYGLQVERAAIGLADPSGASFPEQQIDAVAGLGLGPTIRPARRYDNPSRMSALQASRRTSNGVTRAA